ncbi:hypothetical protein SLS60_005851 [Paraconiothyrium brasiliense]|uniref:C2H2-type domain-containing protein n=1 Tax=Paraconiothyrium brasiliense TaxID=300254 RepID=A0ABR3RDB6_9PLEO
MSDIPPDPSPEQLPTTSLPTTTTLIPPPTPSLEPQAAISKFSSLFTLSNDLTNYLLGRTPSFITDHPFNTLFAGAALALSARFIYRDHTRRSRKNVQLAVFHILKILQANPQYYDNVSDEDHWHLVHAQIEDEVNEAIAAHHLTTGEGAKVTRALKHKLWDKNLSIRRSMQGEFVAKRRKLKADQKEDDAAKARYLKETGKEEDEKKEVERPKKKTPKKPSFPPLKPRRDDDDDDNDGAPPPGGSGFVRPPGTPYAGGLSIFPDGQAQRPTRPQLPPAGQTPNGGPEVEDPYGPLSSVTTSQLGLPPRESPTILDPRLPPDTDLLPLTPGLPPSGSRFPTGNPRPANSLTFSDPSNRPPMPSFPIHFTVTPPIEASRINQIGPNGRDWWPCEFCKRMIWVGGWPRHIIKDSHIRRKKRAELKRQQQQSNASDSTSAGQPGKKEAGHISTNAAPRTVPPGKDPVRYCDICKCPILLKRWDAHLNWPSHKRLKPNFGRSDDNHSDDDPDDNPDDGPHGNTDAFGQQIKPHKTNTPAPASTNRPTPAPPSSQQLDTNRRESQAALANPISANVTVAPNGQVTLTPAAPTPTQPAASAVIPPSLAPPALPPPPVTPAGALTSTSRPQLPLSTPATNRRYKLRDRNNVIDRATKIAYHTAGLKTPTQFMDAVNAGLSPIPELEEGDEGFGTPPLPKLYNPTVKNKKPVHKVGEIVYGKTAKRTVRPDPLGFLNEVEPGSALDESQLQEQLLSEEGAATQPAVDREEGSLYLFTSLVIRYANVEM